MEVHLFTQIHSSSAHPILKLCLLRREITLILLTYIPTTGAEDAVINFRGFWRKHFLPREDDHQDEGLNSTSNVLLKTPTNHLFAKAKKKNYKNRIN